MGSKEWDFYSRSVFSVPFRPLSYVCSVMSCFLWRRTRYLFGEYVCRALEVIAVQGIQVAGYLLRLLKE